MKGVPLVNGRHTKGVSFSVKNSIQKGKGLDSRAEPPPYKTLFSTLPAPGSCAERTRQKDDNMASFCT